MKNSVVLNDVEYGSHERQRLDILFPERVVNTRGVILFVHGGGWVHGDKSVHTDDAKYFCDKGYISATMNYRFVTEELHVPDILDDVTSALKVIKEKCAEHGYKVDKLILSGGSAGAHIVLLYAYTRRSEAPIEPVAVGAYCPPVDCSKSDFLLGISGEFEDWKYEVLSKVCGVEMTKITFLEEAPQAALKKLSPCEYVTGDCVPTAVFHGRVDELIPFYHAVDYVKLLNEKGVKNDFVIYDNSNHALDKDPDASQKAKDVIESYAKMYL